jgi:hypothetical protein
MARAPRAKSAKNVAKTQRAAPADFATRAGAALKRGDPEAVSDAELRKVLAAAVRLYAAKAERRSEFAPFAAGTVTTTESVVAACALIRAADLNLFDVAMWFHRAPSRES